MQNVFFFFFQKQRQHFLFYKYSRFIMLKCIVLLASYVSIKFVSKNYNKTKPTKNITVEYNAYRCVLWVFICQINFKYYTSNARLMRIYSFINYHGDDVFLLLKAF